MLTQLCTHGMNNIGCEDFVYTLVNHFIVESFKHMQKERE